ncbi:MAG TPA: transglutaminase-like domain-containing protein [Candidatus Polarisedimenticolia bacterium]|jgi:regulator of sirC expression with transglutaminase-like and TPR domain|nr:transglutaminase-like domain-containing protein [Candidatus Polarisedimenticolia bacterium]
MVHAPGGALPLDRGALLIARSEYPDLDHARYLAEFDRLSAMTRRRLPASRDALKTLEALNAVLFGEEGYRGNQEDYYDPRNSYINDVMDRKLGIPITLSVLYLEVARRLALPLTGVSFPGHFLLRLRDKERELFVDPFNAGEILLPGDLPGRLSTLFGAKAAEEVLRKNENRLPPAFLADAGPREILIRMLTNLREIHLRRRDLGRGRRIVAMLLVLAPGEEQTLSSLSAIRKIEAALN